jgi:hypothetical protein
VAPPPIYEVRKNSGQRMAAGVYRKVGPYCACGTTICTAAIAISRPIMAVTHRRARYCLQAWGWG